MLWRAFCYGGLYVAARLGPYRVKLTSAPPLVIHLRSHFGGFVSDLFQFAPSWWTGEGVNSFVVVNAVCINLLRRWRLSMGRDSSEVPSVLLGFLHLTRLVLVHVLLLLVRLLLFRAQRGVALPNPSKGSGGGTQAEARVVVR